MNPIFISITSTGQIWVANRVDFIPAGTVVQHFRVNPDGVAQLLGTLTGSGNASASALACVTGPHGKTGRAEGNEVH